LDIALDDAMTVLENQATPAAVTEGMRRAAELDGESLLRN
jgi:hypothetical protein